MEGLHRERDGRDRSLEHRRTQRQRLARRCRRRQRPRQELEVFGRETGLTGFGFNWKKYIGDRKRLESLFSRCQFISQVGLKKVAGFS